MSAGTITATAAQTTTAARPSVNEQSSTVSRRERSSQQPAQTRPALSVNRGGETSTSFGSSTAAAPKVTPSRTVGRPSVSPRTAKNSSRTPPAPLHSSPPISQPYYAGPLSNGTGPQPPVVALNGHPAGSVGVQSYPLPTPNPGAPALLGFTGPTPQRVDVPHLTNVARRDALLTEADVQVRLSTHISLLHALPFILMTSPVCILMLLHMSTVHSRLAVK